MSLLKEEKPKSTFLGHDFARMLQYFLDITAIFVQHSRQEQLVVNYQLPEPPIPEGILFSQREVLRQYSHFLSKNNCATQSQHKQFSIFNRIF